MADKIKKKVDSLMDLTKQGIGIGVVGGAGLGAMGALGQYGAPVESSNVVRATSAGVGLAAVGHTAKVGMTLVGKPQKKKTGNNVIDNILG